MKLDIAAVFEQLVSGYARLPLAQKIALPLLVFASTMIIVFVTRWGSRPDYAVLYSGLEESDASAVMEQLKTRKIGYRLRDDGSTVEVTPPDMVQELRLDMASAGIPRGGKVGFELFSETTLGRTRFAEELLGLQAIQGELERTIRGIGAVKNVRVHVTKPKRSVFAKKDLQPTASVLLQLKVGQELKKENIRGIANLVAGAVEGLESKNVTIVDEKGHMLNGDIVEEEGRDGELTRFEYQHKFEASVGKQVETMLGEILGPGRAVARVTADMDFSKREREEEAYDPGGTVVLSERTVDEGAGGGAEGGVPGVLSNLSNSPGLLTPPNNAGAGASRRETMKNYQVSKAKSITIGAPGSVKRLTVAVLVDGRYSKASDADAANSAKSGHGKQYEPLSSEMLSKIDGLVKQAVGYDVARGDVVTVENMQFFEADDSLVEVLEAEAAISRIAMFTPYAIQGLAILLFFLVLLRPLVRNLVAPTEAEVDLSRLLPAGVEELEAELETERSKSVGLPDVQEPTVDIAELEKLIGANSKIVRDNPQQAALLIRYWLNEGRI